MHKVRVALLIGLASATAAAPSARQRAAGRRLAWPDIDVVSIGPDTVWFCAKPAWDKPLNVTYYYVRATREWRVGGAPRTCSARPMRMMSAWDVNSHAVAAAPGVRVEIVESPRRIAVTDTPHDRRLTLAPADSPRFHSLARAAKVDSTISTDFGGVVVNDSLIWIGLVPGERGDYGSSLGGLFRIDRRSGAWSYIVDTALATATVTGLGQSRDWLWIGTANLENDGYVGRTGLLRMDLRNGSMHALTSANSPLPDALINAVAADDDIVAIATSRGLAVAELGHASSPSEIERWSTTYFIPHFAGDSLVFGLGTKADVVSAADEARYSFAQTFAPAGRVRALYDALAGVPAAVIDSSLRNAPYQTPDLAHPAFAPALEMMLSIPRGDAQRNAAAAIRELGPRTPARLRAATRDGFSIFDTLQARTGYEYMNRRELAKALDSFSDTTATHWAHGVLGQADSGVARLPSKVRGGLEAAIGIVADAKDSVGLQLLEALSGADPGLDKDVFIAFGLYDSPRAWRDAIDLFNRRYPDPKDPFYYARALMSLATPTGMANPEIRSKVTALLDEWLHSKYTGNQDYAAETITRLRVDGFSHALVGLLSDTAYVGGRAYVTLVNLYGRADAPVFRGPVPREAISWWSLVTATGALPIVSRESGDNAVREWLRRPRLP